MYEAVKILNNLSSASILKGYPHSGNRYKRSVSDSGEHLDAWSTVTAREMKLKAVTCAAASADGSTKMKMTEKDSI